MFKKIISMMMAAAMGICSGGCVAHKIQSSELTAEITAQEVEKTEVDGDFIGNSMNFAFELFQNSYSTEVNSLVSPLSVMLILGMTANGADGKTLEEFEEVLGGGISAEELSKFYKSYVDSLPSSEKTKLEIANSIWIKDMKELKVRPMFLQKSTDYFDAQVYQADFDEETLNDINLWVDDNTDGMIDKILDEIPAEALMILINAITFDAEWEEIYTMDDVGKKNFTAYDGDIKFVEVMYGSENAYLEDENTTGFIKRYKNGYSFVALLPDEDLTIEEYVETLTGEKFASLVNGRKSNLTYTMIPKFKYEYEVGLNEALSNMGLKQMFDSTNANFSQLAEYENGNIYVGAVLHKTYIEMAEKGTKAAAVTAEILCGNALPMDTKEVYLDRPFVYVIMDNETNMPIFVGTVLDFE